MKNRFFGDSNKTKGWTEKRLIDTAKFRKLVLLYGVILNHDAAYKYNFTYIYRKASEQGLSKELLANLIDMSAKKMFASNRLWAFVNKYFHKDLKIPFLFGIWTTKAWKQNLVTTRGKQVVADQLNGVSSTAVTAIAIGTGTNAAAAGDTALQTESTTNGGSRGAATTSHVTTTTTNDTAQWVKTFTFTGSIAVTEEGLFDNNASGGNMLARQVFSAVNVVNTDTLQITHKVSFA